MQELHPLPTDDIKVGEDSWALRAFEKVLALMLGVAFWCSVVVVVCLTPMLIVAAWIFSLFLEGEQERDRWLCAECCRFDRSEAFGMIYRGSDGIHTCRGCGKKFAVRTEWSKQ